MSPFSVKNIFFEYQKILNMFNLPIYNEVTNCDYDLLQIQNTRKDGIVKRNIIKIKMKVVHLAFNLMDFTKWITPNPFHIIYLLLTFRFCPPSSTTQLSTIQYDQYFLWRNTNLKSKQGSYVLYIVNSTRVLSK